jgi:hypothetical protein
MAGPSTASFFSFFSFGASSQPALLHLDPAAAVKGAAGPEVVLAPLELEQEQVPLVAMVAMVAMVEWELPYLYTDLYTDVASSTNGHQLQFLPESGPYIYPQPPQITSVVQSVGEHSLVVLSARPSLPHQLSVIARTSPKFARKSPKFVRNSPKFARYSGIFARYSAIFVRKRDDSHDVRRGGGNSSQNDCTTTQKIHWSLVVGSIFAFF